MESGKGDHTMSITSMYVRRTFKKSDDERDAGLTTPEDVKRFDDIQYGPDPEWQMLDVYRPREAEGPLSVLVSVHGGGWVYGDKEIYQYYCMDLARRGFAVVNFTYRLAPEFKFPAPLEDTNLVCAWILDHAGEYGMDPTRFFAVGDSAGAHILGLYAEFCTNPEYAALFSFQPPEGFVPTALALNCGAYRITLDSGPDDRTNRLLMRDFLPEKGTPQELEEICVLDHVTPRFPPAIVMTSYGDFLKAQAPLLEEALRADGVAVTSLFYGDEDNQLGHVFHLNIRTPDAIRCNDEECEFFRSFCE